MMLALFTGLPRWAHGLIAAAGLGIAALLWLHFHDKGVIDRHEAKVTQAIATQSAQAADAAASAVSQTRSTVEQTNDDARNAAARSNDPLRAGLGRLRANADAAKPAAH